MMNKNNNERVAIKFCFKVGISAMKTFKLLKVVYGDITFFLFFEGRELVEFFKRRSYTLKIKIMLVIFFDSQNLFLKVQINTCTVNALFYQPVMDCLCKRTACVRS